MEEIESIKSKAIREISLFLFEQGHLITFFGRTWTNQESDWIYFNTVLDLGELIDKFDVNKVLVVHENLDPKSGFEKGLVDPLTGEGVMGLVR